MFSSLRLEGLKARMVVASPKEVSVDRGETRTRSFAHSPTPRGQGEGVGGARRRVDDQ